MEPVPTRTRRRKHDPSGTRATARPRSRRGLVGLLTSQAISLTGTRISAIALPWFVLVSTGSATRTGMVAFCEMAPYVVVKALTGPLVDRLGPRRVNVTGDLVSAVLVGAIPLLHLFGLLHFGVLLALVALLGAMRGPADSAKEVLIPDVVADAQVPTERVTGLTGTIERLASTIGPAVAGAIVGLLGPLSALVLDSVSFALSAAIIATTGRAGVTEGDQEEESVGGYVHQLREGFDYLRRERLLRAIIGMVAVTNLLDAAMFAVLVPVWARDSGRGPAAVGLVAAVMSAFAVGGSLLAATLAHRLPRRTTYLLGYFIAGAPRFVRTGAGRADLAGARGARGGGIRVRFHQPDHRRRDPRTHPTPAARPGQRAGRCGVLGRHPVRRPARRRPDRAGRAVPGDAGVRRDLLPRHDPAGAPAGVARAGPAPGGDREWSGRRRADDRRGRGRHRGRRRGVRADHLTASELADRIHPATALSISDHRRRRHFPPDSNPETE